MKHYFTFLALMIIALCNAQQFELLSGVKYETQTINYDITDIALVGGLIEGITEQTQNIQNATNRTIIQVNQTPLVNIDTINIMGFNDFADRRRKAHIKRYLATGSARLFGEGYELVGTLELGTSNTHGLSAGGQISGFLNAGLANYFGAAFEPLEIGTFTQLRWHECLSLGYSIRASTESMFFGEELQKSFDVKVQLPFTNDRDRKEYKLNLFIIKSFGIGWGAGLTWRM